MSQLPDINNLFMWDIWSYYILCNGNKWCQIRCDWLMKKNIYVFLPGLLQKSVFGHGIGSQLWAWPTVAIKYCVCKLESFFTWKSCSTYLAQNQKILKKVIHFAIILDSALLNATQGQGQALTDKHIWMSYKLQVHYCLMYSRICTHAILRLSQ